MKLQISISTLQKKVEMRRIHYFSGVILLVFTALHLSNHLCSIISPDKHIEVMNTLRNFYRNSIVESILLLAVLVQIISGFSLFKRNRKIATTFFEKLNIWTGLYLAVFFVIHVTAVMVGRYYLRFDTNYYYSAPGFNFPFNLFFIPYYGLAILSFFGHISAIHHKKMEKKILGLTPEGQSKLILLFGTFLTILLFYGLTSHFKGVEIPKEHDIFKGNKKELTTNSASTTVKN